MHCFFIQEIILTGFLQNFFFSGVSLKYSILFSRKFQKKIYVIVYKNSIISKIELKKLKT